LMARGGSWPRCRLRPVGPAWDGGGLSRDYRADGGAGVAAPLLVVRRPSSGLLSRRATATKLKARRNARLRTAPKKREAAAARVTKAIAAQAHLPGPSCGLHGTAERGRAAIAFRRKREDEDVCEGAVRWR